VCPSFGVERRVRQAARQRPKWEGRDEFGFVTALNLMEVSVLPDKNRSITITRSRPARDRSARTDIAAVFAEIRAESIALMRDLGIQCEPQKETAATE
jgi:hypothetical protein